jgi:hypothetical protein
VDALVSFSASATRRRKQISKAKMVIIFRGRIPMENELRIILD